MATPAFNADSRTTPCGSPRPRWPSYFRPPRKTSPPTSRPSTPRLNWKRGQLVRITYKFARKAAARSPASCANTDWKPFWPWATGCAATEAPSFVSGPPPVSANTWSKASPWTTSGSRILPARARPTTSPSCSSAFATSAPPSGVFIKRCSTSTPPASTTRPTASSPSSSSPPCKTRCTLPPRAHRR